MLKDKILELDENVAQVYQEYVNERHKLNKFTGREFNDEEILEVNSILKQVHLLFGDLMPFIEFVKQRNELAINIYNEYMDFIEQLKKGGATLVESESI